MCEESAALARPGEIGEVDGKAGVENAGGEGEEGLTEIEDRGESEIEAARRLSKRLQGGENNDIEDGPDHPCSVDESA